MTVKKQKMCSKTSWRKLLQSKSKSPLRYFNPLKSIACHVFHTDRVLVHYFLPHCQHLHSQKKFCVSCFCLSHCHWCSPSTVDHLFHELFCWLNLRKKHNCHPLYAFSLSWRFIFWWIWWNVSLIRVKPFSTGSTACETVNFTSLTICKHSYDYIWN